MILPAFDPFRDEWFRPNGWGCKCRVKQITRSEAEQRGASVAPSVPDTVRESDRTGETRIIPKGLDPG